MQKPSCIVRNRFSWVTPAILSRSVRNFTQWQGFRWDASLETVDNLSSWATFYNADFREMWIPYTWINNVINPFGNEMAIFTLKGSFTPKPTLSQVSVDVLSARTFLPELPSAADSQYLLDFCQPDSDVASRRRLRSADRRLLNVPHRRRSTFFCGWSAGVEFVARLPERPRSQQRHVMQAPKDVSVCGVLIHVQRIRGFATMRYINPRFTYLRYVLGKLIWRHHHHHH